MLQSMANIALVNRISPKVHSSKEYIDPLILLSILREKRENNCRVDDRHLYRLHSYTFFTALRLPVRVDDTIHVSLTWICSFT